MMTARITKHDEPMYLSIKEEVEINTQTPKYDGHLSHNVNAILIRNAVDKMIKDIVLFYVSNC